MELRHKLEEIAESQETPVQCPGWAVDFVTFAAEERCTLWYKVLPFMRPGVNAVDGRL